MKRNLILSIILLVYIIGFWSFYKNILTQQPSTIKDLETQISEKKRQLLSAQIISKNLQNVNELIQNNLINSPSDSLAMPANMAFLQYLTSLMDRFDIILLSIRPMDVIKSDQQKKDQWATSSGEPAADSLAKEYVEIPYSMTVLASYIQIGQFIQELEKSPRLIRIVRFQMENPLDVSYYEDEVSGKPDQHRVNLDIHTLTILKASFKGGQEQFN